MISLRWGFFTEPKLRASPTQYKIPIADMHINMYIFVFKYQISKYIQIHKSQREGKNGFITMCVAGELE